jgi:hypothetical protein
MPPTTMATALLLSLTLSLALAAGCSNSTPEPGSSASATTSPTITSAPAPSLGLVATPLALADLTAPQIWDRAKKNMLDAESVHVITAEPGSKLAVDLRLDAHQATGRLVTNGHTVTVRRVGDKLYFKADAGYWRAGGVSARNQKLLARRWFKATKGPKELKRFFELTSLDFVTDQAAVLFEARGAGLMIGPAKVVERQPTISLVDAEPGQEDASDTVTTYVASTGPTLPVLLTVGDRMNEYMKFRDWNEPVDVNVPAGAFNADPYIRHTQPA